ncbi:MAG: hypothetical protein JO022_07310 [Acidobacteriaceae bacterium]|nr:hypothetical protein [Acidobacteriaceae bacterium]
MSNAPACEPELQNEPNRVRNTKPFPPLPFEFGFDPNEPIDTYPLRPASSVDSQNEPNRANVPDDIPEAA